MASFTTATLLMASTSALQCSSAFTSPPLVVPALAPRPASRPPQATEGFQRSLLVVQLADADDSTSTALDDAVAAAANGDEDGAARGGDAAAQYSLLRIAASTDRGQYAAPAQRMEASRLVSELESSAPGAVDASLERCAGTWDLLYSDTQLFRSSPFFLAGRTTCRTPDEARRYDWFCDMHRAALAVSTIGPIRQVITGEGRIVNEFEVKAGAVPFLSDFVPAARYSGGLPFTIDGAIVSSADVTQSLTPGEWELYMDTVEIKGSNVPLLRTLLDSGRTVLRSRDLSKFLEENVDSYKTPRPVLRTTYLVDGLRIVRDQDDHVFVYGRASGSEEPTDYSGVMADLGVASLLEGFNDAISKVYL